MSKKVRDPNTGFVEYIKNDDELNSIELSRKVARLEDTIKYLVKVIEGNKEGKEHE